MRFRYAYRQISFYKIISSCLLLSLLTSISAPVQAQSSSTEIIPSEAFTDLYVVYSHPNEEIISVELHNQRRLPNGDVEASISIRGDSLIAYELIFEVTCPTDFVEEDQCPSTSAQTWTNIDFLPLYPGRIYDFGVVRIPAGSNFVVKGAKFGLEEDSLNKMTLIQLSLLAIHLVDVAPPIGVHELPQTVIDSFQIVVGPIGAVATILSGVYEQISGGGGVRETLGGIIELVLESPNVQELIADTINLIKTGGPEITGEMIDDVLVIVDVLNLIDNASQTIEAFNQLREYPELVTATIMPAPEVILWPERYRVFEINAAFETIITVRNQSGEPWTEDQGYMLLMMLEDVPIQMIPLEEYIRLGEQASWIVPQRAPPVPGIYHINFQMMVQGNLVGQKIPAEIVVVPENSSELTALIEAMVENAKDEAGDRFDEFITDLERQISEALLMEINQRLAEIERRLLEICGGTGSISIILIGYFGWYILRKKRRDND